MTFSRRKRINNVKHGAPVVSLTAITASVVMVPTTTFASVLSRAARPPPPPLRRASAHASRRESSRQCAAAWGQPERRSSGDGAPRARLTWREQRPRAKNNPSYDTIKRIHADARSARHFCKSVKRLRGNARVVWLMCLHVCAAKDDLKLMEWILHHHLSKYSAAEMKALVNLPLGRHDYTALCRAAYAGSIQMMKLLISNEADATFVNKHGEDIQHCLHTGVEAAVRKMPEAEIFIRPRFEACKVYIAKRTQWLQDRQKMAERAQQRRQRGNVFFPSRIRQRRVLAARTLQKWWQRRKKKQQNQRENKQPLHAARLCEKQQNQRR